MNPVFGSAQFSVGFLFRARSRHGVTTASLFTVCKAAPFPVHPEIMP